MTTTQTNLGRKVDFILVKEGRIARHGSLTMNVWALRWEKISTFLRAVVLPVALPTRIASAFLGSWVPRMHAVCTGTHSQTQLSCRRERKGAKTIDFGTTPVEHLFPLETNSLRNGIIP